MKRFVVSGCIAVGLCCVSQAMAGRCHSPPAASGSVPVFCDDFDQYCDPAPSGGGACDCRKQNPDLVTNATDPAFANSFYKTWPLDTDCHGQGGAVAIDDLVFWRPDGTDNHESWRCGHGDTQTEGYGLRVYESNATGVRIARHVHDMTADIAANANNVNHRNYVNGAGDISVPLNPDNTVPADYVDSWSARPQALKGTFMWGFDGVGAFSEMIYYTELFMDNDRAPLNYTMQFCPSTGTDSVPANAAVSRRNLVLGGDGQVHASFAVGIVAWYTNAASACGDVNNFNGRRAPAEYRLVVFDGQSWVAMEGPSFSIPASPHPHPSDLRLWDGWGTIRFAIGADYIEVRLYDKLSQGVYSTSPAPSPHCGPLWGQPDPHYPGLGTCDAGSSYGDGCYVDTDCGQPWVNPVPYTVARVPRQYKGAFNKIAIGPSPGLETSTPSCANWAFQGNDPYDLCVGGTYDGYSNPTHTCTGAGNCPALTSAVCPLAYSAANMYIDELAIWDGVFQGAPAACCKADLTCTQADPDTCAALGGVYHNDVASCSPSTCCPTPFADANRDGFVDMADFAALQSCLTIGTTPPVIKPGCICFDKNGDGAIDATDVQKFVLCGTGANVPWTATTDCPN